MKKKILLVLIPLTLFTVFITRYDFVPQIGAEAQARPTLYWGSRGANVRLVQWKLQQWGYYRGAIDGIFGSRTSRAVRSFQARNGLRVDGIVGPATWQALGYGTGAAATTAARPTLYWGSRGASVRLVQWRLQQWGYYKGSIDGIYGSRTVSAVRNFQRKNGLSPDGVVGPRTWAYLGLGGRAAAPTRPTAQRARYTPARGVSTSDTVNLLARVIAAEAEGEPYRGQVAVGAVIMNRVQSPKFPNSLSGVIFQPHAFESVTNGLVWRRTPSTTAINAARDALNGYDPTYGCVFFWNPAKPISSRWIWTRPIVVRIGKHVFAR